MKTIQLIAILSVLPAFSVSAAPAPGKYVCSDGSTAKNERSCPLPPAPRPPFECVFPDTPLCPYRSESK